MVGHIIDSSACYLRGSREYWRKRKQNVKQNELIFLRRTSKVVKYSIQNQKESGDVVHDNLQYMLEKGFGVQRSPIQCDIHKEFIVACLPKIYQTNWDKRSPNIMKQFGVKKLKQEVLVVMGRRKGKSYSAAMFAAAMLLCVSDCSCIIFSTAERTAKLLMTVITDLIEKAFVQGTVKREDFRYETNNKEAVVFYGPDGSKRSLMCLPGSVRVSLFVFFCCMRALFPFPLR